jgi:hypothetical protein|tara:strand:+ start:4406 stop:4711 length:306 start_codon:yes stop_codon:yes gene_type:complete
MTVSIPVQCTILVPIEVDGSLFDGAGEAMTDENGYTFADLLELSRGEEILEAVSTRGQASAELEAAYAALQMAVYEHRKRYPDAHAKQSWFAGVVDESDVK